MLQVLRWCIKFKTNKSSGVFVCVFSLKIYEVLLSQDIFTVFYRCLFVQSFTAMLS